MPKYVHELADWPAFRWDTGAIANQLGEARHRQGRFAGRLEALGFSMQAEAMLATLTSDVLKSSEIEGEILNKDQVRSSIARRMGIDIGAMKQADRHVDGVVAMTLDATQKYDQPLTAGRLFGWHAALFPDGYSGVSRIATGQWRRETSDPMQVVSGSHGRERVHYEAPPAAGVPEQMTAFLDWFNAADGTDMVLRAAIAHLWFVEIHPFEDGNGRIARAITDMLLARSEGGSRRFYSMSTQIRAERKDYYDILDITGKGDLDITAWLQWFLACLNRAFDGAEELLSGILRKARFWDMLGGQNLNERQQKVLNQMLDGFEGKLTNAKWAKLTRTSSDTALRDIADLVERGILTRDPGGGRSTSYSLADTDQRHRAS